MYSYIMTFTFLLTSSASITTKTHMATAIIPLFPVFMYFCTTANEEKSVDAGNQEFHAYSTVLKYSHCSFFLMCSTLKCFQDVDGNK